MATATKDKRVLANRTLNNRQHKVLQLVAKKEPVTTSDVAAAMPKMEYRLDKTRSSLKQLADRNLIKGKQPKDPRDEIVWTTLASGRKLAETKPVGRKR